ncbi:MAG: class I SAM-dependent methyltransferase [Pseudomonadota bacterium]
MKLLSYLRKMPIDLGQKEFRLCTKGSLIAMELSGEGNNGKALDAGCGDGFWSEKLKKAGWQVTSIDLKSDYSGCIDHDLNLDMPIPDNSFDLVVSTSVIGYLSRPEHFIKEIRRVLKPEGIFIITTPNCNFWLNYILGIFGYSLKGFLDSTQKNFFYFEEIERLFPNEKILGYFPYFLAKARISKFVGLLSPTFIVVGKKGSC